MPKFEAALELANSASWCANPCMAVGEKPSGKVTFSLLVKFKFI